MPGRVNQDPVNERFVVRVSIMDTQSQRMYGAQRLADAEDLVSAGSDALDEALDKHAAE